MREALLQCTLSTWVQAFSMPATFTSPTTTEAATAAAISDGLNPMQQVPVVQQYITMVLVQEHEMAYNPYTISTDIMTIMLVVYLWLHTR